MPKQLPAPPASVSLFADIPGVRHGRRVVLTVEGASSPAEARTIVRQWFADLRRAGEDITPEPAFGLRTG